MEQHWQRSSLCHQGGCVEVWRHEDVVMMRDSVQPELGISTTPDQWAKFVAGVKAGEFDKL